MEQKSEEKDKVLNELKRKKSKYMSNTTIDKIYESKKKYFLKWNWEKMSSKK